MKYWTKIEKAKLQKANLTAALVEAMHQANGIRIRARYWPWDETRDSDLLPMTGFKQAYALAKACAGM